jgi:hypothetical protein
VISAAGRDGILVTMEPVRPNAYLRCESRRPSSGLLHGLWMYSLAIVIVASAAIDALWLVPEPDLVPDEVAVSQATDASAYHDAIHHLCRASGSVAPTPPAPASR